MSAGRVGRGILIGLLTTVGCLLVAEGFLRKVLPFADPFVTSKVVKGGNALVTDAHQPNVEMTLQIEEGLPGVPPGSVRFATNNVGLAGDPLIQPKPAGEYRIFFVGGSTAEQLGVEQSATTGGTLQIELNKQVAGKAEVKVYTAAKAGVRSFDHVAMITHRLVHWQPDMIIVLAGINDLSAAILGVDYTQLRNKQDRTLSFGELAKLIATEFQIPRRLHAILHGLGGKSSRELQETIRSKSNLAEKAAVRRSRPVSDKSPATNPAPYRENLLTIVGTARAHGVSLVLMTQASSYLSKIDPKVKDWHWMLLRNEIVYSEERMEAALEQYNDVMRAVAAENKVTLFDGHRALPKSLEYFVDDVHYTPKGATALGKKLAEVVVKMLNSERRAP
jgi:lysophospholipase L1-like esterase